MQRMSRRAGWLGACLVMGGLTLALPGAAWGDDSQRVASVTPEYAWRQTVTFVGAGEFSQALETVNRVDHGGAIVDRVRTWLEEYEAKQIERRKMDRVDFEKYVGYIKARIDREEYHLALGWSLAARDCADDREVFLRSDWIQGLTNKALEKAAELRKAQKWRKVWHIYSQLAALFEREPRYQKLEREALTHLRLEAMFGEKSHWEERVEKVRWKDAERALEYISYYYVEPADFRAITESGLEQLLLLTESKTAKEEFESLQNETAVSDFRARVEARLDQVRNDPELDYRTCREHFRRVVETINPQTIELPEKLLVSELMRGAIEPLDEFTTIIWPRESKEFDKHTRGNFVGVGISIIKNRAEEIEVVTPLEDTPAYRAGIQAGDIIIGVDGTRLDKNISINAVVDIITGPKGTPVTLTVRRGSDEIPFPLMRDLVRIRSVKGMRRDPWHEEKWDHWLDKEMGVGYLRVINFQSNTVEDVMNVLSELSAEGLKGLVLDLRGNPGGLLDSAWKMSSLFLKRGATVVTTKGRMRHEDNLFRTPGDGAFSDIPLVVLVDERSASASEIVSGSIRDNGRGVVIGERTFGKFSVQNLIPLNHRTGAKLKITTARYYLPSGVSLHREPGSQTWGVEPDIPIRLVAKEARNVYQLWREANLLGPPKATAKDDDDDDDNEGKDDDDNEGKDDDEGKGEDKGDKSKAEGEDGDEAKPADEDAVAHADKDEDEEESKLPPLKQPDENDRPKEDPQLDTALLMMRVTLLGNTHSTLATAEREADKTTAKP